MKYKIGDKVFLNGNFSKFYTVTDAKMFFEISGERPSYQLSCSEDCWYDECDLEPFVDKKSYKYDMDFSEVLSEIFDTKGWYQGKEFKDGVYITVEDGAIIAKQFPKGFGSQYKWPLSITYGVTKMKYRRVYAQPDVERRV